MSRLNVPGKTEGFWKQKRSRSLEHLESLQKNEKHAPNLSPGLALRGLKKKLVSAISKSSQDVVGSIGEDSKKPAHALVKAQLSCSALAMEKRSREEKSRSSLKLDGRKRSKTTDTTANGHTVMPSHEQLSVQISDAAANVGRSPSFTGDSSDQFVVVDNISIDDSVDGYGITDEVLDDIDGGPPDKERSHLETEKLKSKMNKTKQQLLALQQIKAENVQEFLESHQDQKDKINFEKRQQKTNANIQLLQKKLDKYQKMYKDYDERGVGQHRAKEMFRGMHDAVKAGASSISGAVTKPLESMNKLIKKDRRSGSVDNIGAAVNIDSSSIHADEIEQSYLGSSDEDNSSISSCNNQLLSVSGSTNVHSVHPSIASELDKYHSQNIEILTLRKENEELREHVFKLKEDLSFVVNTTEDERFRFEDLQSQVRELLNQYHDLTELHQIELMEVKEELYKASDRIECVDYRSAERAGEIEEALDSCVTRINKMELQQQQQQQLLLSVDGYFDGSGTAKLLLSKVLSLVISLFAIILVIVSICARILSPFISTWRRVVISISCLIVVIAFWRNIEVGNNGVYTNKISNWFFDILDKIPMKTYLEKWRHKK